MWWFLRTFTTWLYVARQLGVEEKLREGKEAVGDIFRAGLVKGIRTDGVRNLRSIETTIVALVELYTFPVRGLALERSTSAADAENGASHFVEVCFFRDHAKILVGLGLAHEASSSPSSNLLI